MFAAVAVLAAAIVYAVVTVEVAVTIAVAVAVLLAATLVYMLVAEVPVLFSVPDVVSPWMKEAFIKKLKKLFYKTSQLTAAYLTIAPYGT